MEWTQHNDTQQSTQNTACCKKRASHHNQQHIRAHSFCQPNIPTVAVSAWAEGEVRVKMIKSKDEETGRARDLIASWGHSYEDQGSAQLWLSAFSNGKNQSSGLCQLSLEQWKENPVLKGRIPAGIFILQVDRAFSWALTSLGKSIFFLVGQKTRLEPGSQGLDRDIINPTKWILETTPSFFLWGPILEVWGTYSTSTNTLVKDRESFCHQPCF